MTGYRATHTAQLFNKVATGPGAGTAASCSSEAMEDRLEAMAVGGSHSTGASVTAITACNSDDTAALS